MLTTSSPADSRTGWSATHVLALLFVADPAEFVHIADSHGAGSRLAMDPARPDCGNGWGRLSLPGFDAGRGRIPVQLRHRPCRRDTAPALRRAARRDCRAGERLPARPAGHGGTADP